MKSILLIKKHLGLVEMLSGLVNASFSLPERQAVKIIFFAPCTVNSLLIDSSTFVQAGHLAKTFTQSWSLPFYSLKLILYKTDLSLR